MAEYIDVEKAIEAIEEVWNRKYAKCGYQPLRDCYRMLMKRLKSAPEADVVEVVRCRDCRYFDYSQINNRGFRICQASKMDITENDFCSYGERSKDDEV